MKHQAEVTIDAPLAFVWKVFDDPDSMRHWQPTLESFTHQSGEPGQPGAVSELVYVENGRRIVMTETISERREPDFLAGFYEADFGRTIVVNHFIAVDERTTKWTMYCNHRFSGMMKLMSLFVGGSIRRRTEADAERFKLLVESRYAEQ